MGAKWVLEWVPSGYWSGYQVTVGVITKWVLEWVPGGYWSGCQVGIGVGAK